MGLSSDCFQACDWQFFLEEYTGKKEGYKGKKPMSTGDSEGLATDSNGRMRDWGRNIHTPTQREKSESPGRNLEAPPKMCSDPLMVGNCIKKILKWMERRLF